jgi:hypothetical protein
LENANVENSNMLWKRREIKNWWIFGERENKNANGGIRAENQIRDNYHLFSQREHHILGLCARSSPYLKDYFAGVTRNNGAVGMAFLTRHVDLLMEYLAAFYVF